jgi:hypothetical protein
MANPPKDPQKDLLSRRQYLVDLSMVPLLDRLRDDLPKGSLLVPETLDKLLRLERSGDELAVVFTAATMPSDPTSFERKQFTITPEQLGAAMVAYRRLFDRGVIASIPDEEVSDPTLRTLIESLTPTVASEQEVVLSDGTAINAVRLVRTHVGSILNHSKRKGTAILSRGRSLTSRVIGKIDVLHLADKTDNVIKAKQAFSDRWLSKVPGATTTHFAIGVGLTIAGFFSAIPVLGYPGLVLVALDP